MTFFNIISMLSASFSRESESLRLMMSCKKNINNQVVVVMFVCQFDVLNANNDVSIFNKINIYNIITIFMITITFNIIITSVIIIVRADAMTLITLKPKYHS